jgi:hypothetical protein
VIAAVLGITGGVAAVGSTAAANAARHHAQCAKSSKSKTKQPKRGARCKKARRTETTGAKAVRPSVPATTAPETPTTTAPATPPAEEASSATIIVHTEACAPTPRPGPVNEQCRPDETVLLRISRLGPNGEVLTRAETENHTVRVTPGRYEIRAGEPNNEEWRPAQVTVGAGQELAVTLENAVE